MSTTLLQTFARHRRRLRPIPRPDHPWDRTDSMSEETPCSGSQRGDEREDYGCECGDHLHRRDECPGGHAVNWPHVYTIQCDRDGLDRAMALDDLRPRPYN